MRIINTASGMTSLLLGRLGENERTQFVFDVSDWLEEYPDATIAMYFQAPHSGESYPVVISQPENGKVTWTVADSELQETGYGKCELVAVQGETVVKGHIWKTNALESLDGAGEAPEPWESWMTEFTALKGEAEDAAEDAEDAAEDAADAAEEAEDAKTAAENARDAAQAAAGNFQGLTAEAEGLAAGADPTITVTHSEGGFYNFEFGIPKGDKGDKGDDGDPAPAATVTAAVEAWLDENVDPETGYVLDRTLQANNAAAPADLVGDLKNEVNDLSDKTVIQVDSEKAGYHEEAPTGVTFYPDDRLSTVTAKYTGEKNLLSDIFATGKSNGITRTKVGNLINLSGTGTSQLVLVNNADTNVVNKIKGNTFNIYVFIKKSTAWGNGSWLGFYDGKSYKGRKYFTSGGSELIGWTEIGEVTFASDANQLTVKFDSLNGSTFTEGDCIWIGMYETPLTDTEQIVAEDPYSISVTGLDHIDTATHESTAKYIESTKEYVDNHIPAIDFDEEVYGRLIYISPEMFGAKGDGSTDDATALADCLTYSATYGKPIRGYGKYKTSSSLTLGTRYQDVYLKEIVYTGVNSAVNVQHDDIVFGFHRINSSGIGISMGGVPAHAYRCQIEGNEISSAGHCIEIKDDVLYDTFEVKNARSTGADCIHRTYENSKTSGEMVFRSFSCHCPNGYVSYEIGSSKLYDFTVESNCKYGLLNPAGCICFGWRHREQVDAYANTLDGDRPEGSNGPLIMFTKNTNNSGFGFQYISTDAIPWFAIDVSQIKGYDPIPNGDDALTIWGNISYKGIQIYTPVCGAGTLNSGGRSAYIVQAQSICFIGNNKVFIPAMRKEITITSATYDYRLFESQSYADVSAAGQMDGLATDFVTGADTTIYLNASYGAVGYNDITITQKDGYKATIYDKLGNVLFDGTNEENGKWRLVCIADSSSYGRYQGSALWWRYDGTNEKWEITKLS